MRCYHVHVTWIERIPRAPVAVECYVVCERVLEAYQEAVEHLSCELRQMIEEPTSIN